MESYITDYGICLSDVGFDIIKEIQDLDVRGIDINSATEHYVSRDGQHLLIWKDVLFSEKQESDIFDLLDDFLCDNDYLFLAVNSEFVSNYGEMQDNDFHFWFENYDDTMFAIENVSLSYNTDWANIYKIDKITSSVVIKNTCNECGGSGIIDMEFYTRRCMKCYEE